MPNIIPPIVSSSPPPLDPIEDNDDDENDEFGDFTTADFAAQNDFESTVPKTISDTSWSMHPSKNLLNEPDVFENGIFPLMTSMEEGIVKFPEGGLDEDDVSQIADSASQDSVMSTVTDSGLCSASQNSSGTSPMPNVEVEYESTVKLSAGHELQNGCDIESATSNSPNYAMPDANQNIRNLDELELQDRDILPSSEVAFENSSQLILSEKKNALNLHPIEPSKDKVAGELALSTTEKSEGLLDSVSIEETDERNDELLSDSLTTIKNGSINDDFGKWEQSDIPLAKDHTNCVVRESQSGEELSDLQFTESGNSCDLGESVCERELSRREEEPEENECVKAMIIPEMPLFDDDDDDDDDDEFGDFSESVPVPCESNAGKMHEENIYESPSRRPTLVLTDNSQDCDVTNESVSVLNQPLCTSSEALRNDPIPARNDIVKEKSSKYQANMGEDGASSLTLNSSDTVNHFEDEFADFAHAEVINEDPISDVWAQAAQVPNAQSTPQIDSSDFDDFDDFESAEFHSAVKTPKTEPTTRSLFDLKEIQSNLDKLLKANFPVSSEDANFPDMDSMSSGLSGVMLDIEDSAIWQGLRDLELTPSLSFQWPGSHSNRGLLGALNIDSRNILFGPKWNTVVPRFAANLGFSPLEPVRAVQNQQPLEPPPRTEIIPPQVEENVKPAPSDQGFQEVVPAAQFDWSDSGLINPLDSNKDPSTGPLATTAASGNPVLTTTPLQVEQLLANSKRSTPLAPLDKKGRDPSLSPEAVRVLDTLPELAFLSARMLMFPLQGDHNQNKL